MKARRNEEIRGLVTVKGERTLMAKACAVERKKGLSGNSPI